MIPKIIHHLAPRDKNKWHPIWEPCYESWKEQFDGFIFKMWNDEDLDPLIDEFFPEYSKVKHIKPSIIKIDFIRFCILYKFGGIYADMDVFCYNNFYKELNNKVNLVQSPAGSTKEVVSNCLMISEPEHIFFKLCAELAYEKIIKLTTDSLTDDEIMSIAGPYLLSDIQLYGNYKIDEVSILPFNQYNPHYTSYDESYFTKHMMSGQWATNNKSKEEYLTLRGVDIDKLDFRKEYLDGVMAA